MAYKYDNRLGIAGWLGGGRWGVERYLYIAHRLAGLGILAFFIIHIFASSVRCLGPQAWKGSMLLLNNPIFKMGELLVFIAFVFHAFNGLRLVLIEFGLAVGKAEEPVYPYRSSVNTQRPLMLFAMALSAILILVGGFNWFSH
jgi:succinate dehydrogenase / fumarate reductase cytochrome b subunit